MKLTLLEAVNASPLEKQTIVDAVALIQKIVATKRFADLLMAAHLTETQGRAGAQVLQSLDVAELSITVWLYSKWWSKVIGYTYFKTNTIYVNRKFFHGVVATASNLLHECSHILGYTHYGVWETSVPYTLNRIFEQCCAEGLG